ncbi:hypothetical protein [Leeuwenhoekiella sp. MAR_2009_132]|uniref:hypothetical protein n=1 Tax=Leeuwenhoekiella sp. MAR_2009_132 TaxID=1392489 RepID=UPI00048AF92F|nr:hypothetical protein [Leeuwenhoekiella sp. MAR_2009_132]
MSILKKSLVVISIIITAISCNNNTELQDQYNSLFKEVIAVHDEIMPKMNELTQLQEQIKNDTTASPKLKNEALKKLQESDDRMMSWMHSFTDSYVKQRIPVSKMSTQELESGIKGLQTELEEVTNLKEFTYESLETAKKLTN